MQVLLIVVTPLLRLGRPIILEVARTMRSPSSRTIALTYDFIIDWGDGTTQAGVSEEVTHTYASPGTYTIKILGTLPRFLTNGTNGDAEKLLSIDHWGNHCLELLLS